MERVVRAPRNHVQMSMHDDLPGAGAVRKMQIECIRIQRALDCNADSGPQVASGIVAVLV